VTQQQQLVLSLSGQAAYNALHQTPPCHRCPVRRCCRVSTSPRQDILLTWKQQTRHTGDLSGFTWQRPDQPTDQTSPPIRPAHRSDWPRDQTDQTSPPIRPAHRSDQPTDQTRSDQTGPTIRPIRQVQGSDWCRDQTGPGIRPAQRSDRSSDQTGPVIRGAQQACSDQ